MRKLILIKHSKPLVQPEVPSHEWPLSDEGRARCAALAERVKPHAPAVIVASEEPKATETGRIVAEMLGVPFETAPGLHEHDRSNVPHMASRDFISYVALLFQQPDKLVLGQETASEAFRRFSAAIDQVIARHPEGNIAIVTHGTVLALLAERRAKEDGFQLFRRMGLPSMIAFELPGWVLVEKVEHID